MGLQASGKSRNDVVNPAGGDVLAGTGTIASLNAGNRNKSSPAAEDPYVLRRCSPVQKPLCPFGSIKYVDYERVRILEYL